MVLLEGNTIHTDLYTKPTDTHQYLHVYISKELPSKTLYHLDFLQPGPKIKKNPLTRGRFHEKIEELKANLMACGYQESLVDHQMWLIFCVNPP